MNDPNGPIFWHGNYHMFCQYNPNGAVWGDMHWAHAVSKDMVHWRHLPVALAPTPGGPDAGGCFTGSALVYQGHVHMMYTGVRPAPEDQATIKDGSHSLLETQCLAVSDDPELKTWTKVPQPVIVAPPAGFEVNGFRDPSPWQQSEWWYTVLGSGIAGRGGAILLYRSKDLRNWEFMHVLAQRDQTGPAKFEPVDPWEVWECSEFFPLGDQHVLIYSTLGKAYWQCGKLDAQNMTFRADRSGILDYGAYYAPKTQLDQAGNRILWGWIQETRPLEDYKKAGWAGMMSLPRVLTLAADGRLSFVVAAEVNELRGQEQTLQITSDEPAIQRKISAMGLQACCGEILLTARRGAEPYEMHFTGSAESAPAWLRLRYDPAHPDQVFIDARPVPLALGEAEDLEFHLHADGSVIELLVNRQVAWTKRFYYAGASPQTLQMQWQGKTAAITRLSAWQLNPISNDRLTT
jgi:beta-fructofuranosidase